MKLSDAGRELGIGPEEVRLLIRSYRLKLGPVTGGAPTVTDRSVAETRDFLAQSKGSLATYVRRRSGLPRGR